MDQRRITPVILSGGSGTRLWPLSREERPKQLIALTAAETMLQITARRVDDVALFEPPVIVASERHADEVERQLNEVEAHPSRLILEPCARNTAAAIALAALSGAGDELLLVMPSDHLIGDRDAFVEAVRRGTPLASQGWLVTFGIRPDRAETGYGYIRRGEELAAGVFRAAQFVEKPDSETAEAYLSGGGYDWNGGIFLFQAGAYLAALEKYDGPIYAAALAAINSLVRDDHRLRPDLTQFAASPSRSVDHAIMEKAARVAVVPVDMNWSDIGSWDALYDIGVANQQGNVMNSNAIAIGSEGCLIHSDGAKVVAIGVTDLIIVASADAILVIPRGQSQRTKEAVDAVRKADRVQAAS